MPPAVPSAPRPWWRTPAALAIGAYALVALGYGLIGRNDTVGGRALRGVLFCVPPLLIAAAALRQGRRADLPPPARRAWTLFAAAAGANWLANVVWTVAPMVRPELAGSRWIDGVSLLSVPLNLAAFLSFPVSATRRQGRGRLLLDALLIVVPAALGVWYLGTHAAARGVPPLTQAFDLAFPLGDALTMLALASVVLRGPHPLVRPALRWLAWSQMLATVGDYAFALVHTHGGTNFTPRIDLAWLLAWATGAAAVAAQARARPPAATEREVTIDEALLPYAFVALCHALVLAVARPTWPSPLAATLLATLATTLLLVLRQAAATRTNRELLRRLERDEAQYRRLFERTPQPMWVHDLATGAVLDVNSAALRHYGYSRPEFLVLTDRDLPSGGGAGPVRVRHQLRSGVRREVEVSTDVIELAGRAACLVVATDVTEREAAHAALTRMAYHDALTALPNRASFEERLAHALAPGGAPARVAVLFLDLDDFKLVNDTLGHAAGDELLRGVADRLHAVAREGETVARFGGDEFAVLATDVVGASGGESVARRLVEALERPLAVAGHARPVRTSIGIALAEAGDDAATLLGRADAAMYAAKRDRKRSGPPDVAEPAGTSPRSAAFLPAAPTNRQPAAAGRTPEGSGGRTTRPALPARPSRRPRPGATVGLVEDERS